MVSYLANFLIYTLAMIGVMFTALFVFKKFSVKYLSKKSAMLAVEDSMNLSARKTLYVVKAQNERFLIAADLDRTSLIAKLDDNCKREHTLKREDKSFELNSFDGVESINDFASLIEFPKQCSQKGPMMKKLAKKLKCETI